MSVVAWLHATLACFLDNSLVLIYKLAGASAGTIDGTAHTSKAIASDVLGHVHVTVPSWIVRYLPASVQQALVVKERPEGTGPAPSAAGSGGSAAIERTATKDFFQSSLPANSKAAPKSVYVPPPADAVQYEESVSAAKPAAKPSNVHTLADASATVATAPAKDAHTLAVKANDGIMPGSQVPKLATPEKVLPPSVDTQLASEYQTPRQNGVTSVPGTPDYNTPVSPEYSSCTDEDDRHSGNSGHSFTGAPAAQDDIQVGKKQSRVKKLGKRISKRLKKLRRMLSVLQGVASFGQRRALVML
ncbi:hypothetical protein WJX72_006456 [[Myrmecia] bisecta]|uniref:Uncharacterized protein n=1 Tax=[Myrmecia] bisecta TaxID=41462 RepID=A0AAW1PFJ2_9CHLO